jgi:hypothetical protein
VRPGSWQPGEYSCGGDRGRKGELPKPLDIVQDHTLALNAATDAAKGVAAKRQPEPAPSTSAGARARWDGCRGARKSASVHTPQTPGLRCEALGCCGTVVELRSEVDLYAKLWICPAERMKMGKEHLSRFRTRRLMACGLSSRRESLMGLQNE